MTAGLFISSGLTALGLPDRSLDFAGSGTYLSMPDSDFGSISTTTIALSFWSHFSASQVGTVFAKYNNATFGHALLIQGQSSRLKFVSRDSSGNENSFITTTHFNDTTWRHVLVHFDAANGTASNRIKVWVNGVAETASSSSFAATSIADTSEDARIGIDGTGGDRNNGKLYQLGFFSGALPAIGSVYDSGRKDISLISGLHSYIHTDTPNITDDSKRTANWTNNGSGGVVLSSDIPT